MFLMGLYFDKEGADAGGGADEQDTDSILHEGEDGELYITVDDEDDSPQKEDEGASAEPEEDKPSEEKPETGSEGDDDPDQSDKTEEDYVFGDDVPATYRGKTAKQVMEMHINASKELVKKGQSLTTAEQQLKEANLSPEEIRKRLNADQVKTLLDQESGNLMKLNRDLDPEDYEKQSNLVEDLRTEYMEKRQDEKLNEQFNSEANRIFRQTHRTALDDQGFELDDAQYDTAIDLALKYSDSGRLTADSVQHALIDMLGIDAVTKTISMKAGEQTREDIKKAKEKEQPLANVNGMGKGGRRINVNELMNDEDKFNALIDKLPLSELKKLRKRIEARGNM